MSTFEHIVAKLGLSPEEYATSILLKDWVWKHKNQRYVPTELLQAWGFDVDASKLLHITSIRRGSHD